MDAHKRARAFRVRAHQENIINGNRPRIRHGLTSRWRGDARGREPCVKFFGVIGSNERFPAGLRGARFRMRMEERIRRRIRPENRRLPWKSKTLCLSAIESIEKERERVRRGGRRRGEDRGEGGQGKRGRRKKGAFDINNASRENVLRRNISLPRIWHSNSRKQKCSLILFRGRVLIFISAMAISYTCKFVAITGYDGMLNSPAEINIGRNFFFSLSLSPSPSNRGCYATVASCRRRVLVSPTVEIVFTRHGQRIRGFPSRSAAREGAGPLFSAENAIGLCAFRSLTDRRVASFAVSKRSARRVASSGI